MFQKNLPSLFFLSGFLFLSARPAQSELVDLEKNVTLSGKLTEEWVLVLDKPLKVKGGNVFPGVKKMTKIPVWVYGDDSPNFRDEHWEGSHLKIIGNIVADIQKDEPPQVVLRPEEIIGKPQPLSGPLLSRMEDIRLSGSIREKKISGKKVIFLDLDKPINLGKGSEFTSPHFDMRSIELVGLDTRRGLKNKRALVLGQFEDYGIQFTVKEFNGIKGRGDRPIVPPCEGPRKIMYWTKFKDDGGPLGEEVKLSVDHIRDLAKKNGILLEENRKKSPHAFSFVCGDQVDHIDEWKSPEGLEEACRDYFGLKGAGGPYSPTAVPTPVPTPDPEWLKRFMGKNYKL